MALPDAVKLPMEDIIHEDDPFIIHLSHRSRAPPIPPPGGVWVYFGFWRDVVLAEPFLSAALTL